MQEPVYMLAIDHRWQWEEWCDVNGVDRARIPDIKSLAGEAFLSARESSEAIRRSGALLVDLTYGRQAFDTARAAGAVTGTPAERAGAFPLEWTAPFDAALPGSFVKVLVRHRPDVAAPVVLSQRQLLLDLQRWCAEQGKPLVLEVLVSPATDDPGAAESPDFDAKIRPRMLAAYIREAYGMGIVPGYWKIEGMPDRAAFGIVDEAIRAVEGPRQLILGKGAGMDQVRRWFGAAAGAATAAGFAIGRTVYFDAAANWAKAELSREEAIARISANYHAVVQAWEESHR